MQLSGSKSPSQLYPLLLLQEEECYKGQNQKKLLLSLAWLFSRAYPILEIISARLS